MGLCNLYQYQTKKTVKLSDAYSVDLYLRKDDFATDSTPAKDKTKVLNLDAIPENYKLELFNCTDVTLPSFKYKTEIYKYGNNEKTFLIPDYSSLDDLSIELMEYYDKNDNLVVQQLVNLFLNKLFNTDTFSYRMHNYIDRLDINVYDNNFSTLMYTYTFKYLKLTNYTKYDLDYSSNNLAKWKLSFSYMEYQAIPKGTRTYNLNGENDPNVSTPEPVTETNVDFAEMYKAIMAGRAGRAPSDSTSMLTPNAYSNNNSDDIAVLKPQIKKLSQNIENQQAHVAAAKAKVKELEDKIAAAEAEANNLTNRIKEDEVKYAAALEKTQGLMKNSEDTTLTDFDKFMMFSKQREEAQKKSDAADIALNKNLADRLELSNNINTAKTNLSNTTANIASLKTQLAQEKQNLDSLNRGFNNLKLDYNNKINELSEMENLKKDQIESLENRYGSMNSLSQQDFNANHSSYAESMSQASRNANDLTNYAASMKDNAKAGHISDPYTEKEEALARGEHNLHVTTSQKASKLWSPDQSELDNELSSINEVNKISLDMYKFDDPDAQEALKQQEETSHIDNAKKATALWNEADDLHKMNTNNQVSPAKAELDDSELDEINERTKIYDGMSEAGKKVIYTAKAYAEAEEIAEKKFAEKAGVKKTIVGDTEYTDIEHAEEIFKHKDFQARVNTLLNEAYSNNKSVDPMEVQQKVLHEYMDGKLKLK